MSKNKQYAVLGLGRFGQSIVKTLSEHGCSVMACDMNHDLVQEISQYATHVVQVDVTDDNAMASLGLGNFDVVVIAIGDNMESSTMATFIAKESGAKYVLAKAQNLRQKTILEKVGADRVVLPEWEMGTRIAMNMIATNVIDFINLSDEYSIAEIEPYDEWIGLSLQKANIRAVSGLNIVAIKRNKKVIISPKPDDIIEAGDVLVAIGRANDIYRLKGKEKHFIGDIFG